MAHPQDGSSSTVSRSNWNLEMLVFEERGKPEYPEKNLSEQGREPTTNSTAHMTPSLVTGDCLHHCAIPAPTQLEDQRTRCLELERLPETFHKRQRCQYDGKLK